MQDRLQKRLRHAMLSQNIHALLLTDPENTGYASGVLLPYVRQSPDRAVLTVFTAEDCVLYLPPDLAQAAADQQPPARCVTVAETVVGLAPLLDALCAAQGAALDGTTLGLDFEQTTADDLAAFARALPQATLVDAGPLLRDLRMVKLPEEIQCIETACRQADTGIIGAINHMEGAHMGGAYKEGCYTVTEFVERIRVHAYEGGTDMSGHMGAFFGPAAHALYSPQEGFLPREGLVRMEYNCCHAGYWSVNARMLTMNLPQADDLTACAAHLHLNRTALALLTASTPCQAVYRAVVREANLRGITLRDQNEIGYGVGRHEHEGPFLSADSTTVLEENMVVALDIVTQNKRGELLRSIDIYAITSSTPRLLSWFRNWDTPYAVTGFRSAH